MSAFPPLFIAGAVLEIARSHRMHLGPTESVILAFYLARPKAAMTCGSSRWASNACPSAVRCTPSG
jgi:hypothetical protein